MFLSDVQNKKCMVLTSLTIGALYSTHSLNAFVVLLMLMLRFCLRWNGCSKRKAKAIQHSFHIYVHEVYKSNKFTPLVKRKLHTRDLWDSLILLHHKYVTHPVRRCNEHMAPHGLHVISSVDSFMFYWNLIHTYLFWRYRLENLVVGFGIWDCSFWIWAFK